MDNSSIKSVKFDKFGSVAEIEFYPGTINSPADLAVFMEEYWSAKVEARRQIFEKLARQKAENEASDAFLKTAD